MEVERGRPALWRHRTDSTWEPHPVLAASRARSRPTARNIPAGRRTDQRDGDGRGPLWRRLL